MKKIFPTELYEFLQCRHIITLKKSGVQGNSTVSEEVEMLRKKGHEHEKAYLDSLEGNIIRIDTEAPAVEQRQATIDAMQNGVDYIYQAYFEEGGLAGYADFLEKADEPSALGQHSYEIIDTKLANRASAENAVQLIHYAELAAKVQKKNVEQMYLVHGNLNKTTLKRDDYIHYYREVLQDFQNFQHKNEPTEPFPVSYCNSCRYREHCQNYWQEKGHLSQVGGMTPNLCNKLNQVGVADIKSLMNSKWSADTSVSQLKFRDIQRQAESQNTKEILLKNKPALIKLASKSKNIICLTFYRHIQPINSFTFFMGLKTSQGRFESLNIHDTSDEKEGFRRITDFFTRYLQRSPETTVFVYSQADLTLIHDLSNRYNICHDTVDDLIYKQKLMALQPAIKQSLVLPVKRYDLTDLLEVFNPNESAHKALKQSPQILYDLYESGAFDDSTERINQRAQLELNAMHTLLTELAELTKNKFYD